jgi:hypothetical protein
VALIIVPATLDQPGKMEYRKMKRSILLFNIFRLATETTLIAAFPDSY